MFDHVIVIGVRGEAVQHLDDHTPRLLKLGCAKAARGRGRGAEPDARGDGRLPRVERYAVHVAGDPGALKAVLGLPAGQPLGRRSTSIR